MESVDNKNLQTIKLMDCVSNVVEEEVVEGMQTEEEGQEDKEKEFDEHVWTSPKNAIQIVEHLRDKLCKMDAKNAKTYQKNAASYIEKLQDLDAQFTDVVQNAKRKEIIVADRFPFQYLPMPRTDLLAAYPGCSTQTGASAETNFLSVR